MFVFIVLFIFVFIFRCTEALLLHSGYAPLPRRKMLWENKVDCRNPMVTEAIRRDEVDAVLANLHFCDNAAMTGEDRYYKVKVFLLITF